MTSVMIASPGGEGGQTQRPNHENKEKRKEKKAPLTWHIDRRKQHLGLAPLARRRLDKSVLAQHLDFAPRLHSHDLVAVDTGQVQVADVLLDALEQPAVRDVQVVVLVLLLLATGPVAVGGLGQG